MQLVATPLNETGAVVSNRTVEWRSSDTTVAVVNSQGLVFAIGAGPVTITATCEGREGSITLDVRAGRPVGPEGGTLALLDGAVTIVVPPGALPQTTTILVRPAVSPPPDPGLVPGTAYEIGPEGLIFWLPAALSLRYEPGRVPSGIGEATLQLYRLAAGAWEMVRGSTVDVGARTIAGSISGAGTYAAVSTPVDRLSVTGPLASGALYVGQSGQLEAVAFAANGDTLRGAASSGSAPIPGRPR
ncbi:MAG TPA: Ig-like domain-containing protein [Longimicrobiales bacterium]